MAQPTPYSRQYNFTNFQTVSPTAPLPAASLDLEFNTLKATLDEVLGNLKLIQRDDTALANQSVGVDQLKDEVTIGINPPAPWVTSTNYVVGDSVTTSGRFYRCAISHMSGTFATDLASGDWTLVADFNTLTFDLAGATHLASPKSALADQDEFPIADSEAVYGLAKTTWAVAKSSLFAAWGALIAAGTPKSTPIGADMLAVADSASANATVLVTLTNLFAQLGVFIAAFSGKSTPVDADTFALSDSASSSAAKKLTWANLKAGVFAAWGALINAGTGKSVPVAADAFALMDSAATNATKKLLFSDLLTAIPGRTLLATLDAATTSSTLSATGLPTTYSQFQVVLDSIWAGASGSKPQIKLSSDNSTYGAAIDIGVSAVSGAYSGMVWISGVGITADKVVSAVTAEVGTGDFAHAALEAVKTSPTTALQFLWSATTFANSTGAMKIRIYGVK